VGLALGTLEVSVGLQEGLLGQVLRIVMVADAYDAMTSTRSYRQALPREVAIAELRDKSGDQFHPECAAALIRALERRGDLHGPDETHVDEHWDVKPPEVGVGSAGLGDLLAESDAGERRR